MTGFFLRAALAALGLWLASRIVGGLVIKKDPGELVIWAAFACLIAGLSLTFYFPRRRIWARIARERGEC